MELCDFEFARFGVLAIIRILFFCKKIISNTKHSVLEIFLSFYFFFLR